MPNEIPNKLTLKLEAVVEYEPNGVNERELTRWLAKLPHEAYQEGTLTMDSAAECVVKQSRVTIVSGSQEPTVRAMTAEDYLRNAIWALDDVLAHVPSQRPQAIADMALRLRRKLAEEMSKGPKEVKNEAPANQDAANAP